MKMISEQTLREAVNRAGLAPEIFERIRLALVDENEVAPAFEAAHIAYYLGAMLIIGARGWFITSAWDRLSGASLSGVALAYGVGFWWAGASLWRRRAMRVPGGVLTTVAVCMTPMFIYGIERQLGWWPGADPGSYTRFHPYIHASWVCMEAATILVAAAVLRFVRFPFVTAPAAYALWYLSMDATALLFGRAWTFRELCWISAAFGLVMMGTGYLLEKETQMDLPFWFYLFGLLTFTGGLTIMGGSSQVGKAVYCVIHFSLILLAILLRRRVFLVFGSIGVFAYLCGEAAGFFKDSFGFTVALTVLGAAFIAAGLLYKRNEATLASRLRSFIPRHILHRHV